MHTYSVLPWMEVLLLGTYDDFCLTSRVEFHRGLHPIGRLPAIWNGWNPNQKVRLPTNIHNNAETL